MSYACATQVRRQWHSHARERIILVTKKGELGFKLSVVKSAPSRLMFMIYLGGNDTLTTRQGEGRGGTERPRQKAAKMQANKRCSSTHLHTPRFGFPGVFGWSGE